MRKNVKFTLAMTVAVVMAMVGALCVGITAKAAGNEPRIEGNIMYLDAGSNDGIIYGTSCVVAGANRTEIVPLTANKRLDVQVLGKIYKGIAEVIIVKDDKQDNILLSENSIIISVPNATDNDVSKMCKSIIKNSIGDVAAADTFAKNNDAKGLAYRIVKDGKIETASKGVQSSLLKTDVQYKSIVQGIADAEENIRSNEETEEKKVKEEEPSPAKSDDRNVKYQVVLLNGMSTNYMAEIDAKSKNLKLVLFGMPISDGELVNVTVAYGDWKEDEFDIIPSDKLENFKLTVADRQTELNFSTEDVTEDMITLFVYQEEKPYTFRTHFKDNLSGTCDVDVNNLVEVSFSDLKYNSEPKTTGNLIVTVVEGLKDAEYVPEAGEGRKYSTMIIDSNARISFNKLKPGEYTIFVNNYN